MTKYELELRFKEVALEAYNKNFAEPVSATSVGFTAYLEAIIFGMIPREEFESWIEYYERKLAE